MARGFWSRRGGAARGKAARRPFAGATLALVPIFAGAILGALLLPYGTTPMDVPLPRVDLRVVAQAARTDRDDAAQARRDGLPSDVRALGSALRAFNTLQARDEDAPATNEARRAVDVALRGVLGPGGSGVAAVRRLRAVHAAIFLDEARRYEATGAPSDELVAVAGPFTRVAERSGWAQDHRILLSDDERRVAFELAWNGEAGVDHVPELALTRDEMRLLYAFHLRHPHVGGAAKEALAAARAAAKDPRACADVDERERRALDTWLVERVRKLGTIDPDYPTAYALGVLEFRRGRFGDAADAFEAWLKAHPTGAYALRARAFLRTAVDAERFPP